MFSSTYKPDISSRTPLEKTDEIFVERWSPRSFKKTPIPVEVQDAIFDAARFSPSAYNDQPWRIYASRGEEDFGTFLSLLVDANQVWAKNASIIGYMVASRFFSHNKSENHWSVYDCGFAWAAMTFQARSFGLYTHGMAGVKYDDVYATFDIPKESYKVVAGFAIGVLDHTSLLPKHLQKMETPSPRKDLQDVYFPNGKKREQ